AVAARDSGIDVFIVPSIEFDEALSQAGDMRVETADTLEEAIAVLDSLGGNGLALGPLEPGA
ncbi:MAG: hypothetical protein OEU32_15335, partial [Acidimicrobiia bacterium]|nr:hypothetical protein [Acidimicrobiia bacterium]